MTETKEEIAGTLRYVRDLLYEVQTCIEWLRPHTRTDYKKQEVQEDMVQLLSDVAFDRADSAVTHITLPADIFWR